MSLEMDPEGEAHCSRTQQVAVCFADAILTLQKRGLLGHESGEVFRSCRRSPVDLFGNHGICVDSGSTLWSFTNKTKEQNNDIECHQRSHPTAKDDRW